ncbi:oxidoreductase [Actinoplanes italicus]|uniref:Methane monooxygenase PmoA-like n=1 Tax=Actinoplanes italicus TaxID=113567 RepID=A0A2T0JNK1_9ACTN|nr:PmoA family protein [Actinoplanes italicus]PRX09185.1 methane monooxygenase PmoA-like [Actinoplanes italicus]GIE34824.1 oxidoreductase [Actinoplanes italicus]
MTGDVPATLRLGDRPVAEYAWRPHLPASLAPRPYLHPVRTLGGTVVTELMPASHRHHLGVSVAVAEVDSANFWGGRTFIPGHGPTWLDNQGHQEHLRWLRRKPDELIHTLRWKTIDGAPLLYERRTLSCRPAGPDAWALEFGFQLTNIAERELPIRSPAAHGRAGAGYGGFFWRAPSGDCRVTASGDGDAHGRPARWLSVAGPGWTLVFLGGDEATRADPWFVRTRDYLGIGSSLAWDQPLVLAPHASLSRRIVTVIADGGLPPGQAATYAADLAS